MKKFLFILFLAFLNSVSFAQNDTTKVVKDTTVYRIVKFDGVEFIGRIISSDPHEVLILTKERGLIYVPQHVIKEIVAVNPEEYNQLGTYIGEDVFSTRYFITTNGLPIKKGEHYIQWNLYGPDFQFGIADNFGVGIMTTWGGMPIIGNAKYSIPLSKKLNLGLGALLGTGSWALPDWGLALPYAALSFGDRKSNLSLSGGYGLVAIDGDKDGRALFSVGGITKTGKKLSFVFDSFIILPGKSESYTYNEIVYNPVTGLYEDQIMTGTKDNPLVALIIPGIRWHMANNKAFQFGFAGVFTRGEFVPFPIPMVQWYRKL